MLPPPSPNGPHARSRPQIDFAIQYLPVYWWRVATHPTHRLLSKILLSNQTDQPEPHLGLFGATSVGVGAIVGGGILALAGTAFAVTGPSAMLAFLLNGCIAMLTALSLAEMASRFPESGGTYTFSKKVLSVEAAFSVGWFVCFASIVAALLYALGLAWFLIIFIRELLGAAAPQWLDHQLSEPGLAMLVTLATSLALIIKGSGGGKWTNIAKLIVFGILVVSGLTFAVQQPVADTRVALTPFFENGFSGLCAAMGYTFIALQGFDLIAAVGSDVRNPAKNIPRAMILSLLIALAIYIPLLFVITTVGLAPGESIAASAQANPEGIVASAAEQYLGEFGYWLVVIGAILAMFSALEANLYASSRIIFTMARDRTLPSPLSRRDSGGSPVAAVIAAATVICSLIFLVRDVALAGAVSSLIFLLTFAFSHWISILVRQRSGNRPPPFRTPFFPIIPVTGGLACLALAIFQSVTVPAAGIIACCWLALGSVLFLWLFASRARIRDATTAAINPELMRLRGRSPLVLVPIANPESAEALITLANCLVPRNIGRVMLQNIIVAPEDWDPNQDLRPTQNAQIVMQKILATSSNLGIQVEALTTVANNPMPEIARVAALHRCQSIVMGLSEITDDQKIQKMEKLLATIDMDVLILRAQPNWELANAERILAPVTGRGGHEFLMSGVLGSLSRKAKRKITYLKIVKPDTGETELAREIRSLRELSEDQLRHQAKVEVIRHEDPAAAISERADASDLVILGATRTGEKETVIGGVTKRIAKTTQSPLLVLSSRDRF